MMNTTPVQARPPRRALLSALVLAAILWFSVACRSSDVPLVNESVDQPLGVAARAEVEIAMSVGQLHISALEQPDILIRGDIAYSQQSRVVRGFVVCDDTATFTLREDDSQRNVLDNVDESPVWNLWLSKATPLRLTLETGVGESTIDLSQLHVTYLDLKSGVGAITVMLPHQAMRAELSGGIGSTTVVIPAGVPVRVESSVGLGNITAPSTYRQQGQVYVSPGADTAAGRIELTVNGGIGGITIKQSSE
jgi:hypothetical protein